LREHIPKKHGNLEEKITTEKVFDLTSDRIYGERVDEAMRSENYDYGRSTNPADSIPKVGRRNQLLEKEVTTFPK
jgi:hypothetical protein